MAEKVAVLEAQMKDLIGNGQPGRVGRLEEELKAHSRLISIGFGLLVAVQFAAANGWLRIH